MNFKNNIEEITINKKGIILIYKESDQKEILYSDLDEIYITVNKIRPFSEFVLFLISIAVAIFSILIFQTNIILTLSLIIVITIVLKMNTHRRYGLKIVLRNGEIFEKKIQARLKHEKIDIVNEVKKEIYNYKIKKNNERLLHYSL